jgi:hypothetical protein
MTWILGGARRRFDAPKTLKTTVMVSEANHLADIAVKYGEIPPSGQDDMGFRWGAALL